MSLRLRHAYADHHLEVAVEEIQRVVRARPRLRVVLRRRAAHVAQQQALDGPVVEVHVRELGHAEVGVPAHGLVLLDARLAAGPAHREAVVLRS